MGHWELKTDQADPSIKLLEEVSAALLVDGDSLEAALDAVIELELFIRFWALEPLVAHGEGYAGNSNNTFVYFDPDWLGKAVFALWGPDDAMQGNDLTLQNKEEEQN